jgi:hypothetical protein
MRSIQQVSFFAAVVAVLFLSVPAAAITLGQADRFGADNDMGWHPTTPSDAMLGGPGGASDYYLEFLSNGGSFSEGKMVIRNSLQWSGNYSSEGVRVISLDAQNRGDLTMNLRIAITNASGRPAADDGSWYATTVAIDLAPGTGWAVPRLRAERRRHGPGARRRIAERRSLERHPAAHPVVCRTWEPG